MSWTQDDLTAINASIANGSARVRYADREVQYRSLAELIQIRDAIRRELGVGSASGGRRVYAHDKGV